MLEGDDDDDVLVERAKAGSSVAWAELFDRHWQSVWRTAYKVSGIREVADDAAQEAFIKAARSVRGFQGRSSFRTWVTSIALNAAVDIVRRDARIHAYAEIDRAESPSPSDADALLRHDLLAGLAHLDIDQRTAVVLRYWLGYTPDEIADLLGVKVGTVNSRLARGLTSLRSALRHGVGNGY